MDQQYNIGEKPTVIMYTIYINRHAGPPNKNKTKEGGVVIIVIIYDNAVEPYTSRGLGQQ